MRPGATLSVYIWDVSLQDAPAQEVASVSMSNIGNPPYDYRILYDPDDIDPDHSYAVDAQIRDANGELLFWTDVNHPVITRGAPSQVDIVLRMAPRTGQGSPEPTPQATPRPTTGGWTGSATAEIVGATAQPDGDGYRIAITYVLPGGPDCARDNDPTVTTAIDAVIVSLPLQINTNATCGPDTEAVFNAYATGSLMPEEERVVLVNNRQVGSFTTLRADFPQPSAIVESPVQDVELQTLGSSPPQYNLKVVSGLPKGSGCSAFHGYSIERMAGGEVSVRLTHYETTARGIMCTADFPYVTTNIPLGEFAPGELNVVRVNDRVYGAFTPPRDGFPTPVAVAESPVHGVELLADRAPAGEYTLRVVSGLPQGSGCSMFDGYSVSGLGGKVEIRLTHLKTEAQGIMCIMDYPYVETEIPLGGDYFAGQTYGVVVNGRVLAEFTPPREGFPLPFAIEESPVHSVVVETLESSPPQYSLQVESGLPMGSGCSAADGYSMVGADRARIQVRLTHVETIAQGIACTMDYPSVQTSIPLGSDFDSGERYTVSVNGVEASFTAQ